MLLLIPVRLIEWLEVLRILKVSKVFIYYMDLHPATMDVLEYYTQNTGFVEATYFPLSGDQPIGGHHQLAFMKRNTIRYLFVT